MISPASFGRNPCPINVKSGFMGVIVMPLVITRYNPVSYTHLDVYKRQVFLLIFIVPKGAQTPYNKTLTGCSTSLFNSAINSAPTPPSIILWSKEAVIFINGRSFTEPLDVYKRQH